MLLPLILFYFKLCLEAHEVLWNSRTLLVSMINHCKTGEQKSVILEGLEMNTGLVNYIN